jgi:ribonuclease HI
LQIYTDAARDRQAIGTGWHIYVNGKNVDGSRYIIGEYSSMEAEYFALLDGLRLARREHTGKVEVFSDCKPLLKKMREPDEYSQDWRDRRNGCIRLLEKFDSWNLEWTPRKSNDVADRLAFEALERARREKDL